jgi:hypothetical protein
MEQIKTFAVKVLGMTDDEVQSLYKTTDDGKKELVENVADILAAKDAERINRIETANKQKMTDLHDKAYQKAQKEVLSKFEKEVKAKYGYDTEKMGLDLIDDIVSQASAGSKDGIKDIKTHPEYIKLERQLQTEFVPKTRLDEVATQFEQFKQNVEKTTVVSKVKEDARKVFRSLNPILSKDPKRAANQEAEFLAKLDSFDYQVQQDGNHVILKDGGRLENEHKNPVLFQDFIRNKASELYDFAEQGAKGNSGVDGGAGSGTVIAFKDYNDFKAMHSKAGTPEERVKLYDAAKAQGLV